jgi:glyoxylase-like metal-dependent hydrolase (beta-lactamase superfamily II)
VRVAERWFEPELVDVGLVRFSEPRVAPFLRATLFLVRGRDRDALIDSGLGIVPLREELTELFERPVVAVATHRHFDHTGGLYEFDEVAVHRADAEAVANAEGFASLRSEDYDEHEVSGYALPTSLLSALPREGFEVADYEVRPAPPTRILEEGDVVDLGDRWLTVLHLPGHTPGEIGLWEEETNTLFSGDCVYESGILLDELPGSNIEDYVASMRRLLDVPVRVVHGGHDDWFGRERLLELIDAYLAKRAP